MFGGALAKSDPATALREFQRFRILCALRDGPYGVAALNRLVEEILQEAGFHPLEVIRSATMYGAETLAQRTGKEPEVGIVRQGMLADMLIVDANPLENLKVLYGTGWFRLNDSTGKVEPVGGVKYTIKDGIVYDAKQLLADVARMVEDQKRAPTLAGQKAP